MGPDQPVRRYANLQGQKIKPRYSNLILDKSLIQESPSVLHLGILHYIKASYKEPYLRLHHHL